jgi:uncharacterized protein (TIGR02145 family)
MKNKLFRKHASVIPTEAKRSGGISSFRRFLATLGMTVLFCWSATAQNGVTVSNLVVNAGTVTFNVSWNDNQPTDFLWSDTVWVFVDYNNGAGRMERLLLEQGATLTSTSSGGWVKEEPDNNTGVWVVGNARSAGSFSAKVHLHTATADVAGACAYASNYPPVGEYASSTKISFTGTPPYDLVLVSAESSTRTYSINDNYYNLYDGETLQSFTDKTGAPGTMIIKCHSPGVTGVTFAEFTPCDGAPYGSTYTLTDDRNQNTYKVKYLPDNRYWMVQDLKFGNCTENSWMNDTSAEMAASTPTLNAGYVGHCRSRSGHDYGYYYTWPAAMNNANNQATASALSTVCSGVMSDVNTCRGICPASFHVPTTDEYGQVTSSVLACCNSIAATMWDTDGLMETNVAGDYYNGQWSSTYNLY